MSKNLTWLIVAGVVALAAFWCVSQYNKMVVAEENVEKQWSQVENVYQRRADLVPQLVGAVKGYAKHESETFENVIAARAKATQITIDPSNATPEQLKEWQAAQGELGSALGRLMAITESYPELKANENFLDLQAQLEGTENRITEARRQFNNAAQAFNVKTRLFPTNVIASMFNFEQKGYFTANEGADVAPKVEF